MKDFIYKQIDPCGLEQDDYIKIHQELFKGALIDSEWIKWYHHDIRACDIRLSTTRTYGLFDNKRLIGIWSVEPKIMRSENNQLIKVGRCFAVGISSDYRRMGLFVELSKYAIKAEREKGEFDFIIGFPQTGRSVVGGHLKAGWEEIFFNDVYCIDLKNNDGSFFRNDINHNIDFNKIKTPESTINSFDEPVDYIKIRYLEHPRLNYINLNYKDAHIILKTYSTFCHILETKGSNENVKRLIEASKSICKRHGIEELNTWSHKNALYNNVLLECGFKQGAEHNLPVTIIAVRINSLKKININDSFNFGMGVEEGY